VAEAAARRLQQQEEAELRRAQDEEYRIGLEADQEREREDRRRREEAHRAEQEALRAEQRKLERYRAAQDLLRSSDDAVASASAEPTSVRFVLPSGAKLNHKFSEASPVSVLFAYVLVHLQDHNVAMGRIGLSTSFPKRGLDEADPRTLREAQLAPQAVLMVQDLDA
jgi:FAS-associated factor 2